MKKFSLSLFLLITLCFVGFGQKSVLKFNFTTYDFGEVRDWKNQAAIFTFHNTGKSEVMFLPTFPKDDILVELPARKILPGESANIEVYYFTGKIGEFKKDVPIYTNSSKDPINLTVKGNIISLDKDAFVQCPGFAPKPESPTSLEQEIKVIDKTTRQPIDEAIVIIGAQTESLKRKSDKRGIVKEKLSFGLYKFSAEKYGYNPTSKTLYLNKPEGVIILELEPTAREFTATTRETYRENINEERNKEEEEKEREERERLIKYGLIPDPDEEAPVYAEPETVVVAKVPEPEAEYTEEETESENIEVKPIEEAEESEFINEEVAIIQPVSPVVLNETPVILEKESPTLSVEKYNPNNIVFLIDVSSSMKNQNKLPLLKTAMKNLTDVLRKVDIITVITYSSSAHIALTSTTADNKEQIVTLIDSLTPAGWTHGVKGIETAYEMIEANFLTGGNNQIILATDGLFNNPNYSENEMFSLVRQKAQKEIKLSVIGFGDDNDANKMMKKLSDRGGGSFLKIQSPMDADRVLIEEIKLHSLKP